MASQAGENRRCAGHFQYVETGVGTATQLEQQFELLFVAHYAAVLRYARRRVPHDDAPDVAADVFMVAWRRPDEVPANPLPWLYGVARRICANHRRGTDRQFKLARRIAEQSADSFDSGSLDLASAFDRLSDADREVLALIAWEGLSARDASVVLDCTVPAVTMRLHRARRRLAAALAESAKEK